MDIKSRLREFKTEMGPTLRESKFMLTRIKRSPLSIAGLIIILFFIAVAILAPVLAPPNPKGAYTMPMDPAHRFYPKPFPPRPGFPFGTTGEMNYDIYYGCIWGTRSAFRVGLTVVIGALAIGLVIGTLAGYYGGIIDELMMRFTDIIFAFPGLILCMALVIALPSRLTLGLGPIQLGTLQLMRLDKALIALTIVGWPGYTRVIRGEILRVKQEDYVEAAKAVGCSDLRVIVKHILPNSIYPIIIMASLDIGAIVLTAAALSFLGLGAPTDYADWGQMISYARNWITGGGIDLTLYYYTWVIPGMFIFTFVLGWNLLGDAFRDILDPTLRRK